VPSGLETTSEFPCFQSGKMLKILWTVEAFNISHEGSWRRDELHGTSGSYCIWGLKHLPQILAPFLNCIKITNFGCSQSSTITYECVSRSFRIGRLEWELKMVQLSATRCSCFAVLWACLFRHNTLCCFSTSVYCCCCYLYRYQLSPETFGYTLVYSPMNMREVTSVQTNFYWDWKRMMKRTDKLRRVSLESCKKNKSYMKVVTTEKVTTWFEAVCKQELFHLEQSHVQWKFSLPKEESRLFRNNGIAGNRSFLC
jgi:hypothetical protein